MSEMIIGLGWVASANEALQNVRTVMNANRVAVPSIELLLLSISNRPSDVHE